MGFFGGLFGKNKTRSISTKTQKFVTNTLQEASTSCGGHVHNSVVVRAVNHSSVSGVTVDQAAKINLTCLTIADTRNAVKEKLKEDVTHEFSNKKSWWPDISRAEETEIRTNLDTTIEKTFTTLSEAKMFVNGSNVAEFEAIDWSKVSDQKVKQHLELVGKVVASLTVAIDSAINSVDTVRTKIDKVKTAPSLSGLLFGEKGLTWQWMLIIGLAIVGLLIVGPPLIKSMSK